MTNREITHSLGDSLAKLPTEPLSDGFVAVSAFLFLKATHDDGGYTWKIRELGPPLSDEELMGVLEALSSVIEAEIAAGWQRS